MQNDCDLTVEETAQALELMSAIEHDYTLIESEVCVACNGSGYYDANGSPKCGSCNGHGRDVVSEVMVRELANKLYALADLDYDTSVSLSERIETHMKSIGLGWKNEYYFV